MNQDLIELELDEIEYELETLENKISYLKMRRQILQNISDTQNNLN